MADTTLGAVILATHDTGFSSSAELGGPVASLLEVGGKPLAQRVIDTATACEGMERVVVVGDAFDLNGADRCVAGGESPTDSIRSGMEALDGCEHAVLVPGNLPFLSSAELNALVAQARAEAADIVYPFVPLAACEAEFPELRRTGFRLAEGELTPASALFVHVRTCLDRLEALQQAVDIRHEPWRLARMVSPTMVLAFATGRLGLRDIAEAAQRALGLAVAMIVVNAPGLATDIRKPIDVKVARERLRD